MYIKPSVHGLVINRNHPQDRTTPAFRLEADAPEWKLELRRKTNMVQLGVNIDHVATIRQARNDR